MTYSISGGIVDDDLQRKVSREMPRSHVATVSYRSELPLDRPGAPCKSGPICPAVVRRFVPLKQKQTDIFKGR